MKQKITNLPAEYMALSFFMGGNLEDYFLIRDYANTIIDHYKKNDYNIAGIIYLMKGTKIGRAKSSKTFIYGSNVYQINTMTITYA